MATSNYSPVTISELPVGSVLCVEKGSPYLGILKNQRAVVDMVERENVPRGGYRIRLSVGGLNRWLYAANSARLTGEIISLHNGNPLRNVKLVRRPS